MNHEAKTFEDCFAAFFAGSRAFSFWKARVALYAILKALGIGSGDEVILPGYTCVMNVNPIGYLGAKPVYVDIEPRTYNINPSLVEEKITDRTRLIIAQHTYGYPCDMDSIASIAAKRNIAVIEDCCLALGSKYKGRLAGTFGQAAYFSFQWNKPFTTGLGGMATTGDAKLAGRIRAVCDSEIIQPSGKEKAMLAAQLLVYRLFIYPRTTALAQSVFRALAKKGAVVGSSSSAEFSPLMSPDFFKAMSGVQARAGLRQLQRLEANLAHRRKIAALYDELLAARGWQPRLYDRTIADPAMVRYPVRIHEKEKAVAEAASAGIELGTWFECPLHPMETPLEAYGYTPGLCPVAEKACLEVVNLPVHPRVSGKTARKTVDFITRYTQAV
ncbi:MAG TPA: DegT/DnrJ/EryC1/StrS family aminotransferase [Sedimentisphaerales bacterium]|nr:DegT/DnrJ/EryC1/StrS family aminotransferase [Sedimentisphaerales bacterium]